MTKAKKQTIAVYDAASPQGYSVVRFLVKNGKFNVRALIRSIDSTNAKLLAKKRHVEVIQTDANDLDSMKMGFNHCFGAFACIDPSDPQAIQQGKNCVDAAKFTRLEHFIWSTMDSDSSVDHFETLSEINKYLKDSEVPRTSIYPSITYESAIESLIVKKDGESAELILPVDEDVKLPFYSIADTGAWVSILFEHTQIYIDKDVDICSEYVSLKEIGQKMKEQFPELKLTQSDTKINDPKSLESKCFEYFATQNQTAGLRDCQSARRMYPKATDLSKFLKGIKI